MSKYGFYGRLKSEFPSQIIVDLTNLCNLECIHCGHSKMKKSPLYSKANLDFALNKKMIDEVKKEGHNICEYIRYTADGEPMLHKNVFDILEYAVNNCNSKITLTTNGTLLNDENVDRLIDTGLHSVDVSIDAFSESSYTSIRRKGDYQKTKQNVLSLINKKKSTKVFVSFISQPANEKEAEAFEKYWSENGADYVVIRRLHSCANFLEFSEIDSNAERRPCVYPWERIVLTPEGKLTFCPAYWGRKEFYLFDLNTITIKEAWQSEIMNKLRDAHLNNNFNGFDMCATCQDWLQMRWPDEGRAYADLIREQ